MKNRFYIERLIIGGTGTNDASLKFSKGVNLIVGSSDTGKSYIYQCIDYLLGSGTCPKNIPESDGFSEAYLQIRTYDSKVFTINRKLKEVSNALVSDSVYEKFQTSNKRSLGVKNGTLGGENISEFLLGLMGVEKVKLKINSDNKTRALSYRDIARLTLIDESRIITEGSPIYTSNQNFNALTGERSAFRYLLTENSDNELVEQEEKKVYESRIKGKKELIELLILEKNKFIEDKQNEIPDITSDELNKKIAELLSKLEASTQRIEQLTVKRAENFTKLQRLKSVGLQNSELLKRFNLLKDHYSNDLERLNFILEGDFLFKQLLDKDCPVCGTLMNEEHLKCLAKKENKAINESVRVEVTKIEVKLKDLLATINTTDEELKINKATIKVFESDLEVINGELNSELLPMQQSFQSQIGKLISFNKIEQDIINAKNDITKLNLEMVQLENELKSKRKPLPANIDLGYAVMKEFCGSVEKYLRAWKFPKITTVEFNMNDKVFDLTISGRGRNSHGKGVRAISYSAFTFGLLDFCISKDKPHSGFIVLDSPLTTYHSNQKREADDEITPDMQIAFFESLKNITEDRQIIVLDNKIPPDDVVSSINYILFSTEPNSIRKGFFVSA